MTAPSFLATEFAFTELLAVTDVQTIMDAIATMLTSTLPTTATNQWPNGQRWTNPSGTTYKSPPDAAGRFMQLTLTRTSITRMRWQVADPSGGLCDGEIQIAGGGSTVEVYGGPGHCMAAANNGGSWETARAFMSDPTPEPLAASSVYVLGQTQRNTAGTQQSPTFNAWQYRFSGGSLTNAVLFNYGSLALPEFPPQSTANSHLATQAGSNVATPYFAATPSANGVDDTKVMGKLFQVLIVDANLAAGADLSIPIDTGVIGVFRVWRNGASGIRQYAVRKG